MSCHHFSSVRNCADAFYVLNPHYLQAGRDRSLHLLQEKPSRLRDGSHFPKITQQDWDPREKSEGYSSQT